MRSPTRTPLVGWGALLLAAAGVVHGQAISAPVLKWAYGGCSPSDCQTGWYASPAVADVDGDGQPDVVWASYDLVALNGVTGALKWRSTSPNRSWPGVVVADLTGNGSLEVVVGRSNNLLEVHDGATGALLWSRTAFPGQSGEVRSLAVADFDRDGSLDIVVGRASGGDTKQLNVFDAAGNNRPGWPARRDGEAGYGWGMYNENVAVGDLDGDGYPEVIGPTDTHYITALDRNGNQLPANSIYGAGKVWSQVGVHVDQAADLQGYADCGVQHRPNFANSAPVLADVDGDGVKEIVVVGNVYDCSIGNPDGDLYQLPWILKADRTRWTGSGYDWTVIPTPVAGSGPLSEDYNIIQNSVTNAVVADLDGDGRKEILYPSYDGRLHAYWLDKTEHGNWPYKVPGTGIRFAGEPVVVDLNGDGKAEVIFTSWPENGSNSVGQLHVLDYLGNPLFALDLPAPRGDTWNGGLGAPTLANIDSDGDYELVIGTTASGVVAYDLPGTAGARILWGTGRGSSHRTGVAFATGGPLNFQVTNALDTGVNSLRWAIEEANTKPGLDWVTFNLPGAGIHDIVASQTLKVTDQVVIQGCGPGSQSCTGSPGPRIYVRGGPGVTSLFSLRAGSGGSTIQDLGLTDYASQAIAVLPTSQGSWIQNNWIGFYRADDGTVVRNSTQYPNSRGLTLQSSWNTVRGNTISGVQHGVVIGDDLGAPSGTLYVTNALQANAIGTDPWTSTSTGYGNTGVGVLLLAGAREMWIGPWNVISGNAGGGVQLLHNANFHNIVFGNYVGTNSAGSALIPNGGVGISLANGAHENAIGGSWGGNVIAGNPSAGVSLNGVTGNWVQNNTVGLNAAQTGILGGQQVGVTMFNNSTLNTIEGNILAGNTFNGAVVDHSTTNSVSRNYVGRSLGGTIFANGNYGIVLLDGASYNWVLENNFGSNPFGNFFIHSGAVGNIF